MNDVFVQIVSYLTGIWRRRWYVLAVAWLVCGAGWTAVASLPDRYQSSARIYVDMDTMLGPLMRGIAVEMNLFQQIDIMRRTLLSRPNIEKIILMTDLDLNSSTNFGIVIQNSSATFTFDSSCSITNPTGVAFSVTSGAPTVTYSGTIANNSAQTIAVSSTTGGTKPKPSLRARS